MGEFNPKSLLPESFEYVDLESVVGTEMVGHRRESRATAPSRAQRLARTGDIFYQTVRPYQKNNYLYKMPDEDYVFSTGYAQIRPSIDPDFLFCLLQQDSFVADVLDRCTGTSYPAINANGLADIQVSTLTDTEEQYLIGRLIKLLDNLITLHQRKHDTLVKIKKSLLEKMFPREGESVPELRFAGFTDAWEQRKFSEAVAISTDMVDPKTGEFDNLIHIGPGDMEPYTGQILAGIKTVSESELISGKFHFYPGDVVYSKIRPELSKCVIAPAEGLASADAYVLRSKGSICQEFLYTLLHSNHFYDYTIAVSMRTGMPKINRDELGSYSFYVPSIQEQREISAILISLDSLITLHQRKLNLLKNTKSALLEKMFV